MIVPEKIIGTACIDRLISFCLMVDIDVMLDGPFCVFVCLSKTKDFWASHYSSGSKDTACTMVLVGVSNE